MGVKKIKVKKFVKNPTLIDKEVMKKALLHQRINKHFSSRIHPSLKNEEKKLEAFHSHEPQKFINKQLYSISKWQNKKYPIPD